MPMSSSRAATATHRATTAVSAAASAAISCRLLNATRARSVVIQCNRPVVSSQANFVLSRTCAPRWKISWSRLCGCNRSVTRSSPSKQQLRAFHLICSVIRSSAPRIIYCTRAISSFNG